MRALRVLESGAEPTLVDINRPVPGPGEVSIRIAACGLNFADLLMMRGEYQEKAGFPLIPGMELAGTVEALGDGVAGIEPGARVAVLSGSGGLAGHGCFPANRCLALPDAMPFDHAAGFQIAYGTSHVALGHRAGLRAGETLVVLGAAGGVGLTAVEIGHRMGARVIAVARGPERLAVARAAGADHLIDSDATPDLRSALRDLGGADVVYDPVGGDHGAAALRALRPEGRHLVIGFASGTVPAVPANHLLVKNLSMIGINWGGYLKFRPDILAESLRTLIGWYEEGGLHPVISHRLPLSQAAEGFELLRTRRAAGKIVIDCQAE